MPKKGGKRVSQYDSYVRSIGLTTDCVFSSNCRPSPGPTRLQFLLEPMLLLELSSKKREMCLEVLLPRPTRCVVAFSFVYRVGAAVTPRVPFI